MITDSAIVARQQRYASNWFRIRHRDGRWLGMTGEGWVEKDDAYSYLGTRGRLDALLDSSVTLNSTDEWYLVDVTGKVRRR